MKSWNGNWKIIMLFSIIIYKSALVRKWFLKTLRNNVQQARWKRNERINKFLAFFKKFVVEFSVQSDHFQLRRSNFFHSSCQGCHLAGYYWYSTAEHTYVFVNLKKTIVVTLALIINDVFILLAQVWKNIFLKFLLNIDVREIWLLRGILLKICVRLSHF